MRKLLTGAAVLALAGSAVLAAPAMKAMTHKPAETRAAIAAALAVPARADQAGDDMPRKAAEVLAFSGVGPGDTVVDLFPGRGYWTRIFTNVVGPKGHVYSWWPKGAATRSAATIAELQGMGMTNVTAAAGDADLPAFAAPVDLVWTVQNYHDLAHNGAGEPALIAFDKAVFAALKPGGTYIVVDHADAAGTGLAGVDGKHRIDPEAVKREVTSVGFRFDGSSDVLHNPADDHSKGVTDPAIRGATDKFVLRFRKPG